jgi:hypothetical protein
MSADDMLMGEATLPNGRRCLICQALPYTTETNAQNLARFYYEQCTRLERREVSAVASVNEKDELIAVQMERIVELEDIVRRQNLKLMARGKRSA